MLKNLLLDWQVKKLDGQKNLLNSKSKRNNLSETSS